MIIFLGDLKAKHREVSYVLMHKVLKINEMNDFFTICGVTH